MEKWNTEEDFFRLITNTIPPANNPVINRYSNYCLIYEDLRTVLELSRTIEDVLTDKYCFLKTYINLPEPKFASDKEAVDYAMTYNTLLIQSMFTTIVVTYAKWFTKSSGGNKPQLQEKIVLKDASKTRCATHTAVMEYRHQYFAHSGPTQHEIAFPMYHPERPHLGKHEDGLSFLPMKKREPRLVEVQRFNSLFSWVIKHVHGQIKKMEPKVKKILKEHTF